MATDATEVIKVFSVACCTVGECSGGAGCADVRGDNTCLRISTLLAREFKNDFSELRVGAVSGGADIIQNGFFGLLNSLGRNFVILRGDNPTRQSFGGSHIDSFNV